MCRMTTRTGNLSVVLLRRIVLQQLRQRRSPRLVHSGADGGFDGFQIQAAGLAAALKDNAQQPVYFAGNFLADGLRRFFSWAVDSVCSIGRKRQIFRLMSTNSPVKVWNLRNSAISFSALRTAAREGRFCVTVLPSIFWVSCAWGPCPVSLGLAQQCRGFPQRREALAMEPGWKSPSSEIWRSTADLSSTKGESRSRMGPPRLRVSYSLRLKPQKKKTSDSSLPCRAHPGTHSCCRTAAFSSRQHRRQQPSEHLCGLRDAGNLHLYQQYLQHAGHGHQCSLVQSPGRGHGTGWRLHSGRHTRLHCRIPQRDLSRGQHRNDDAAIHPRQQRRISRFVAGGGLADSDLRGGDALHANH